MKKLCAALAAAIAAVLLLSSAASSHGVGEYSADIGSGWLEAASYAARDYLNRCYNNGESLDFASGYGSSRLAEPFEGCTRYVCEGAFTPAWTEGGGLVFYTVGVLLTEDPQTGPWILADIVLRRNGEVVDVYRNPDIFNLAE